MSRSAAILAVLILSSAAVGCSSSGPQRTGKLLDAVEAFRVELAEFKGQVDAAVGALNQVVTQASQGPKESHAAFVSALDETNSLAADIYADGEDLRVRIDAYFAEWEVEAATIQNPDIRRRSDERRLRQLESSRKIDVAVQSARETIDPFLSDLKDLRTLLTNDLTPEGITSSKDLVESAGKGAAKVKERVDFVAREALRVSGELRIAANAPPSSTPVIK